MIHGRLSEALGAVLRNRVTRLATVLIVIVAVLNVVQAASSSAAAPTVVSITFDNGWSTQMTAAADLQAHGMAGTFYVISGWLGLSGFLSLSDLQTLVAGGNEIAGKTVENSDLPTLPDAEAEREICQGRDVLLADGFPVTDFAYPFADLNATSEALVQRRRGGQPELRGVEESRDHVHDVERNPRPIAVASPRRRTSKQRADLCRASALRSAQRHVLAALVEPHAPGR